MSADEYFLCVGYLGFDVSYELFLACGVSV